VLRLCRAEYLDDEEVSSFLKPNADAPKSNRAEAKEAAAAAAAAAQELAETRRVASIHAHEQAIAEAESQAALLPSKLHEAAEAGDVQGVLDLLDESYDPTIRHVRFGFRVPYDVSKDRDTRNAFRKYRAENPEQWDWQAAHVPSGLTEQDEMLREERERQKTKEKKKKAEKARKERRKLEDAERVAVTADLLAASQGEDISLLSRYIAEAEQIGCDEAALNEARTKLGALKFEATDPQAIQRREREKRAAAAEARMKALTRAQ